MDQGPEEPKKWGGARPKVRDDDARGWNARGYPGGAVEFEPTDEHRAIIAKFAPVMVEQGLARKLRIDVQTLKKHFQKELDEATSERDAIVGSILMKKVLAGDNDMIKYYLTRKAGWGDTTKVELTGRGGGPIEHADVMRMAENAAGLEGEALDEFIRSMAAIGLDASGLLPDAAERDLGSDPDQAPAER